MTDELGRGTETVNDTAGRVIAVFAPEVAAANGGAPHGVAGVDTWLSFSAGLSVQEYDTAATVGTASPAVEFFRGSDWGGGIGGILYSLRGGDPGYKYYNSRGDVVAETDDTLAFNYKASYEAYGTRAREEGTTEDRQRANTKDEDPWGALNEGMRYRDLDTGSWMTRDPVGFVDGPNLYAYVVQNPWSKFDPIGLSKLKTARAVAEAIIENGFKVGARRVRNLQFAGKSVNSKMLRELTGVSDEALRKLDKDFPGLEVKFSEAGRPVYFGGAEVVRMEFSTKFEKSAKDIAEAWKSLDPEEAARLKETHVWHHDWDGETLQLIPKTVHDAFQHTGGDALRRAGYFNPLAVTTAIGAALMPRTAEAHQNGGNMTEAIATDMADFFINPDPGVYDFVISPLGEWTNETWEKAQSASLNSDNPLGRRANDVHLPNLYPDDPGALMDAYFKNHQIDLNKE